MSDKPKVVAWMMDAAVDPDDPLAAVKARARQLSDPHYMAGQSAAKLEEPARLFGDEAFDPEQVWDAGLAAGLTGHDLDAASYVALVLEKVQRGYSDD